MDYQVFKLVLLNDEEIQKEVEVTNIYGDDSIENFKQKLCASLDDSNSYHYSFHYKKNINESNESLIEMILSGQYTISSKVFHTLCINLNCVYNGEEKKIYDRDDFLNLDINIQTVSLDHNEPFYKEVADPLSNLYAPESNIEIYPNGNLVIQLGDVIDNTIYATHVSSYKNSSQYTEKGLSLYFPFLDKPNTLNDKYLKYNELIDTHYNLHMEYKIDKSIDHEYRMKDIHFTYNVKKDFLFPQEMFFKKIHSTKTMPLIQFKEYPNSEAVYRLYAPYKDMNGRKNRCWIT